MINTVLCATQPIFNAQLELVAQELLFRETESDEAHILDADRATARVLLNTYSGLQLELDASNYPSFVNVTRNLLLSGKLPEFENTDLVYKYPVTEGFDQELVGQLGKLKREGYRFALTGLVDWTRYQSLAPLFSYVKLDTTVLQADALQSASDFFRSKNIKIIAEKIESLADLEQCQKLALDGYQGYFLTKPKIIKGHTLDTQSRIALELMQELQDPETSPDRIEQLIIQDATLSFKLLRILSTAAFNLPRKVTSVKDAVIFLGLDHIRSWATMIAMSCLEVKSDVMLPMQLVRARMCEQLAEINGLDDPKKCFMVGLFSLLDAMLDLDMKTLLNYVPLDEEIVAALLKHEGQLGGILASVMSYERADWGDLGTQKIAEYAFGEVYLDSVKWARTITASLR